MTKLDLKLDEEDVALIAQSLADDMAVYSRVLADPELSTEILKKMVLLMERLRKS